MGVDMQHALPLEDEGPVMVIKSNGDAAVAIRAQREWEWYASFVMVAIGLTIFLTPKTIELGAFRYLLWMGVEASWAWMLYIGIGLCRVVALLLNGRLPFFGPHVRAAGCAVGALIWINMTLALIRLTEDTGTLSIGIGAWGMSTIFELRALHRALIDVGRS